MSRESEETGNSVNRRGFLRVGCLGGAAATSTSLLAGEPQSSSQSTAKVNPFVELEEATIEDLQKFIAKESVLKLAEKYLARIEAIDQKGPKLNSVIEVNPDVHKIAKDLDAELKKGKKRGPLHGIPILLKDNIDTADKMKSTSGSLALVSALAPTNDAFLVKKLREAGVVILGKTNLSEWAEMRSSYCVGGWSGRGGLTKNPYALDRNPSGSSSGSAVAVSANLCAVAVGTETSSSIVRPSSVNGVVGIKPTLGLISRSGVIPLALSQDSAGPMARTVKDAAILLNAMVGPDRADKRQHLKWPKKWIRDYTANLCKNGLKGKRIGIVRAFCGIHEDVDRLLKNAIDVMVKKAGATRVDLDESLLAELDTQKQWFGEEYTVLLYEFKADLESYLATRKWPKNVKPIQTMQDVIAFNDRNKAREMPWFGQDIMEASVKTTGLQAKEYLWKRKQTWAMSQANGIDKVMDKHKLDALIAPTEGPAWLTDYVDGDHMRTKSTSAAAMSGYPSVSVPMGYVHGLPVGLSFFGRAWSDHELIQIAYSFEQHRGRRQKPEFLPSVKF